ncbi:sigma-70 family RNA polymerase sigma factor [Herpetosiphon llansteffanensis]|uniref:sigma-70 family RNA polymerase sigma factor n=1 Tax=Herpetosiphon llansteffanensis TaxID=2094568 RepID=UPI000D7C92C0|nr:sigma-70 family RNA polymerase sigma factor [Herpetosiphon llansteffanensis]
MEASELNAHDRLIAMITREPQRLMRRIGRLISDDFVAEDLAQESLVRALRNITSVRQSDEGVVCKWLDRIAHNVAINYARDQGRQPLGVSLDAPNAVYSETISTNEPEPAAMLVQAEVQHELLDLIRALPAEFRAVFLLRDVEGLSTAATAQALAIDEGLVKWRLHKARKRLRAQLQLDLAARSD